MTHTPQEPRTPRTTCTHCVTFPDGGRCPNCGEVWRNALGYPDGHDPKQALDDDLAAMKAVLEKQDEPVEAEAAAHTHSPRIDVERLGTLISDALDYTTDGLVIAKAVVPLLDDGLSEECQPDIDVAELQRQRKEAMEGLAAKHYYDGSGHQNADPTCSYCRTLAPYIEEVNAAARLTSSEKPTKSVGQPEKIDATQPSSEKP